MVYNRQKENEEVVEYHRQIENQKESSATGPKTQDDSSERSELTVFY